MTRSKDVPRTAVEGLRRRAVAAAQDSVAVGTGRDVDPAEAVDEQKLLGRPTHGAPRYGLPVAVAVRVFCALSAASRSALASPSTR
jgi:hypothetical protein